MSPDHLAVRRRPGARHRAVVGGRALGLDAPTTTSSGTRRRRASQVLAQPPARVHLVRATTSATASRSSRPRRTSRRSTTPSRTTTRFCGACDSSNRIAHAKAALAEWQGRTGGSRRRSRSRAAGCSAATSRGIPAVGANADGRLGTQRRRGPERPSGDDVPDRAERRVERLVLARRRFLEGVPAVGVNADGRIEVFARSAGWHVGARVQDSPNGKMGASRASAAPGPAIPRSRGTKTGGSRSSRRRGRRRSSRVAAEGERWLVVGLGVARQRGRWPLQSARDPRARLARCASSRSARTRRPT